MDRFIVGSGRCGSTLLSRMLAESPQVLSLFEFFNGLDMTRRFGDESSGGDALVELLSQPHPFVTMVLSRGYEVPEITYPFERDGARYGRDEGLPWLLVSALPRLVDDPDALFDELLGFAKTLPERHLAAQYRALFDWLAARLARELWIERSGSSIEYLGGLHRFFPGARFVHLHRDGPETALSMREHHAFRLAICMVYQRLASGRVHSLAELDELGDLETGDGEEDPIGAMLASRPDAGWFGRFWTQQLARGFRALPRLDASQWLDVRFEDLIERPRETLAAIAEFFALADRDAWIARAAGLIRGTPPARIGTLPDDERERLIEACRPGMQLLGRLP